MKICPRFFLVLLCLHIHAVCTTNSTPYTAVTYALNGGRLGDNLRSYAQAYWLSYKYGIPFLLTPFTHSEQMRLHYMHEHYQPEHSDIYPHVKVLKKREHFNPAGNKNSQLTKPLLITTFYAHTGTSWSDPVFVAQMKKLIAPHGEWEYMPLPDNIPTIALHIRRGGGYSVDSNACRRRRPLHFPHLNYYQDALHILLSRFIPDTCYVYIFTDDQNPTELMNTLYKGLTDEEQQKVTIECRATGNRHDANVVEDFFDMMRFDYLIRPNSMLSTFAERLGNHKVVVHPHKGHRGQPWGNVTEVELRDYRGQTRVKECIVLQ